MAFPAKFDDLSKEQGLAAALQRVADHIAVVAAWIAGGCLILLTLLVLVDTLLAFLSRHIPSMPTSTGVGWEYSAYLMGAAFLLGAGLTLRAGLQLRVEILMTGGKGRFARALEVFSSALGSVVTIALSVWLAQFTWRTYGYGEVSQDSFTPLWIPRLILTIGMGVLALQMVARLMTCIRGNAANKPELGAVNAAE